MKKLIILFASTLFLMNFLISCEEEKSAKKPETVVQKPVTPPPAPEVKQEEKKPELPPPEPEKKDEADEEYIRSTNNLNNDEKVSKQEFNEDKAAILKIIEEMSEIMENQDVDDWLKYIEPDSIKYYKNPINLQKAQKKLPNKSIRLKTINDYFKYVFIPSRKRSKVDEIRYISKTNIKAVQVKDDKSIVVYYYFTKINGKWYVQLPPVN